MPTIITFPDERPSITISRPDETERTDRAILKFKPSYLLGIRGKYTGSKIALALGITEEDTRQLALDFAGRTEKGHANYHALGKIIVEEGLAAIMDQNETSFSFKNDRTTAHHILVYNDSYSMVTATSESIFARNKPFQARIIKTNRCMSSFIFPGKSRQGDWVATVAEGERYTIQYLIYAPENDVEKTELITHGIDRLFSHIAEKLENQRHATQKKGTRNTDALEANTSLSSSGIIATCKNIVTRAFNTAHQKWTRLISEEAKTTTEHNI